MLFFSTILAFHYILSPIASMHQEPKEDAEIVSEAICAEQVEVIEIHEDWAKIETSCDGEQGWVRREILCERMTSYADCTCIIPIVEVRSLCAPVYEKEEVNQKPILHVPWESRFEVEDPYAESLWVNIRLPDTREVYMKKEDVTCDIRALTKEEMVALSRQFLGVPCVKRGRSSFGFDGAGLIQTLYRQMGQFLPRKVEQQYHCSELADVSLEALQPGDLLFWGSSESELQVGICIGSGQFIYAPLEEASCVKISTLENLRCGEQMFCAGRRLN